MHAPRATSPLIAFANSRIHGFTPAWNRQFCISIRTEWKEIFSFVELSRANRFFRNFLFRPILPPTKLKIATYEASELTSWTRLLFRTEFPCTWIIWATNQSPQELCTFCGLYGLTDICLCHVRCATDVSQTCRNTERVGGRWTRSRFPLDPTLSLICISNSLISLPRSGERRGVLFDSSREDYRDASRLLICWSKDGNLETFDQICTCISERSGDRPISFDDF